MKKIIKIEKMFNDVIMPKYQQDGDAGIDIHCYLYDETDSEPVKSIKVWSNSSVKINTGIKVEIPEGHYMQILPRSSMGVKKDLILKNTVGIIDSKYRGEILLFIKNIGNEPVEIINGERLAQAIILPYPEVKIVEVDKVGETARGMGFGSSGVV